MYECDAKANDIFLEAAKVDSPDERRLFLDQQCGNDATLRAKVESLISANKERGVSLIQDWSGALPSRLLTDSTLFDS
jgi:hypothetical protein